MHASALAIRTVSSATGSAVRTTPTSVLSPGGAVVDVVEVVDVEVVDDVVEVVVVEVLEVVVVVELFGPPRPPPP